MNTKVIKKTLTALFSTLLLVVFFTQNAMSAQSSEKPPSKEEWSVVEIEATISAINSETREFTLKDETGNLVTIVAGDQVKRFDEFAVGDIVAAEYLTFLRAEFREPTAEENETPFVVLAEAGKAPKDVNPGAAIGAVVKAVVEVVAIDKPERLVTIQGPRGNYMVLPVKDDAVLNNLKIGEKVIMTYAEAFAIELVKAK
ncbi:MAG: Cu/Ag efflux protein CusF [Psychromonas sp.]|jgi:Cu/Ag efflux protein CusF